MRVRLPVGGAVAYGLGVDLGTTSTAAAVRIGERVDVVRLGGRRLEMPSVVFVGADGGLVVGEAAERRGVTEPGRLAREFKRRIGDPVPILVGGAPYAAHVLTGRLLRCVVDSVTRAYGAAPGTVVVTYPANWGPYKRELFDQAVRAAGPPAVTLRTEPEAAAARHAAGQQMRPDDVVAVYDLGGGTFDAAVLRRTATGFDLLGEPDGVEQLGGADFDEAIFAHVMAAVGTAADRVDPDDAAVLLALARLRRDCTEAKEALSLDTDVVIPVALPRLHTQVRLTRSEFEAMIAPVLAETLDALRRTLHSAGVAPDDLSSVLLVGGSSRIPLVGQLVAAAFGRPVALDPGPEHSVAIGAAHLSAGHGGAARLSRGHGGAVGATAAAPSAAAPPPPVGPPATDPVTAPPTGPAVAARRGRRRRLVVAAVVVAAVAAATAATAAVAWRPRPSTEVGAVTGPTATAVPALQPAVLWSFDTGRPVTSRPVLIGDRLYFGGHTGAVYAVDRRDGRLAWSHRTARPVVSFPEAVGGVVYIAGQDGFVYALGAVRGEVRWKARAGGSVSSSPRVVAGLLYIGSDDGALYAFDLSGRQRWRYPTRGVIAGRPGVWKGVVLAGSRDGHLYAVDAATGRARWDAAIGQVSSGPVVLDDAVLVGTTGNRLYSLDYRTGRTRWTVTMSGRIGAGARAVDGTVYVGDSAGRVYALDSHTGAQRWRFVVDGAQPVPSIPAVADGVVYVGSHNGRVYALNAATGAKLWEYPTRGAVAGSPYVAAGVLYVGSDDGRMYALRLPTPAGTPRS